MNTEIRKLAVGWFDNMPFQTVCAPHLDRIREVYFAWPGETVAVPPPMPHWLVAGVLKERS